MSYSTPFSGSIAMFIGWSLIHSLWLGVVIAVGAATIMVAMRRATSHTRFLVVLFSLLSIPAAAICCAMLLNTGSSPAIMVNEELATTDILDERVESPPGVDSSVRQGTIGGSAGSNAEEAGFRRLASVGPRPPVNAAPMPTRSGSLTQNIADWIPWIVGSWLCGVAVLSFRLLFGCFSLHRLASTGTSVVPDSVAEVAAGIAGHMPLRRTVRVLGSTLAAVPTTIGFFRPLILLPISTLTSLSAKELESILAHELAHIQRNDFLVNVVQVVAEVLLFYHPAVWWLSRRIRQEREYACDDIVIRVAGDRLHYARALAAVAETATRNQLAVAATDGQFTARVDRILGRCDSPRSSALHIFSATVLAVVLLGGTLALVLPAESSASNSQVDAKTSADADPVTGSTIKPIAGVIHGPDGKPLSGATVYLRRRPFRYHESGAVELAEMTTENDGKFQFRNVQVPETVHSPQSSLFPLDVIAMKTGHSIRWRRLSNAKTDVSMQLKKESEFVGTLKDDAGNPVANAPIRVQHLMSLNTITQIDVAAGHTPSHNGDSFLNIAESVARIDATTDAQGRFVLRELPWRVGMVLRIDDRRLVDATWYAATTDEDLAKIPAGELIYPPRTKTVGQIMQRRVRAELLPIHRSPAQMEATRGVHLRFRFVNATTGEPVPSVTIKQRYQRTASATTNEDGISDLHRVAPGSTLELEILPPATTGLLGVAESLTLGSELLVEREFRLGRGAVITGRVVDAESRTGLAEASVSYIPDVENSPPVVPRRVETDGDGVFRLVVPATPGRVVLSQAPRGYLLSKPIEKQEPGSGDDAAKVSPSLTRPVDGLELAVSRLPSIPFKFVDKEGRPLAVSADVRLFSSSNSYFPATVEVDKTGELDLSSLARGSQVPKAIQILARSVDKRLAAFFRSKDIAKLQGEVAWPMEMRPVASVNGRILDKETGKPIPGAKVALSVSYTETGGQGVAAFTCDEQGRFEFEELVPGMRYSLGAGAANYSSLNSIHTRFVAADDTSHLVDISLVPRRPKQISDLKPVVAPDVSDLDAEDAYKMLDEGYDTARDAYRALLDKHRSEGMTSQIVSLREPTPAFAAAFMELANNNRGTGTELKALKWVCGMSVTAGTASRTQPLKKEAAERLLQDYSERDEIADVVSSIIYASADRYAAAERLMKSPHHEVQGRAYMTCADVVAQRNTDPYRGEHPELRNRAIELYEKVIADYSDISHWSDRSIASVAEDKLFELRHLQIGASAPELAGVDLNGKPMKLSEYRGKVVVIHYWQTGVGDLELLERIAREYKGRPLVIRGVNTDEDREKAVAVANQHKGAMRHWHDPEHKIHRRWSGGWPNTHVIGHDGEILYLGQRRSHKSLEDVLDDAVAAAEKSGQGTSSDK